MEQPGAIEGRHRNLLARINRKRGDTLVRTLRQYHGAKFLPQLTDRDDLKNVLHFLNESSLSQLERLYLA